VEFLLVQSVIHLLFCEPSLFDSNNNDDNDRELWGPDGHVLVMASSGCLRSRSVGSWGSRRQGTDSRVRTLLFSPHRHPSPLLLLALSCLVDKGAVWTVFKPRLGLLVGQDESSRRCSLAQQ